MYICNIKPVALLQVMKISQKQTDSIQYEMKGLRLDPIIPINNQGKSMMINAYDSIFGHI